MFHRIETSVGQKARFRQSLLTNDFIQRAGFLARCLSGRRYCNHPHRSQGLLSLQTYLVADFNFVGRLCRMTVEENTTGIAEFLGDSAPGAEATGFKKKI